MPGGFGGYDGAGTGPAARLTDLGAATAGRIV
jgi:hypothetical protein